MRLVLLLLTAAVTVWTSAADVQPPCDLLSQYEQEGRCCSKCGPGTSMLLSSTCEDPQCQDCKDEEYQEAFTTAARCERQPFCDPNKNFQQAGHRSTRTRTTCSCRLGFHCHSDQCLTCVPHTTCPPGSGARIQGNQTHDTVCQECPEGTFSRQNSWNDVCHKHTVCPDGFNIGEKGTKISNNTCEKQAERPDITSVVVPVVVIVLLAVALAGVVYCRKRGGDCSIQRILPNWIKLCRQEKVATEPPPEDAKDVEDAEDVEAGLLRTPVENDDENDDENEDEPVHGRSDNGQLVVQDYGKSEVISQEESDVQETFFRLESGTLPIPSGGGGV